MTRKSSDNTATDAANTTDAADAATVPTVTEDATIPMQDATLPTVDASADGTIEIAPAVKAATDALAQIDAALGVLSAGNPAYAALQTAREDALGALALATADAALDAEKRAQIDAVNALPNMPAPMLASMLAAIEAHYVPAPAAPELPTVDAPTFGRRSVGTVASARNADVAQALSVDASLAARADAAIAAWQGSGNDAACTAQKLAGTRYAGLLAFGGDGVTNRADYAILTTAIRLRLRATLKAGGETVPVSPWIAAIGIYAAGGSKDNLPMCFTDRRAVALYGDGRFRLAAIGTAGVRFIGSDAAAYALFNGGTAGVQQRLSDAPVVDGQLTLDNAPKAAPTPPAVAAAPNGQLAATARCVQCSAKNFVTDAACRACKREDWKAA